MLPNRLIRLSNFVTSLRSQHHATGALFTSLKHKLFEFLAQQAIEPQSRSIRYWERPMNAIEKVIWAGVH
jgi:hypothetical protein